MFNFRNIKTQIKCLLVLMLLAVLYNEHIVYILSSIDWPPFMQCGSKNQYCLKVLFVADPQLIGEINENQLFSSVARWDSDRFIEKNFRYAVRKFKPDAVIFLGDLMDEGSIANDEEFTRYLYRLRTVFPPDQQYRYMWIPGDNDIGGEGYEKVSKTKLERFLSSFKQEDVVTFNGIEFIMINRMTHQIPKLSSEKLFNKTNVLISHMPILHIPSSYSKEIISALSPALIFSAHEHKSVSIRVNRYNLSQKTVTQVPTKEKKVKRYRIGGDMIHEFIVPTCSYRMGVESSGFGAAVINGYGSYLDYAVLWFPSRLQILWNYLYITFIMVIYFVICVSCYYYGFIRRLKFKRILALHST